MKRPSALVEFLGVNLFLFGGILVGAAVMFVLGTAVVAMDLAGTGLRVAWLGVAIAALASSFLFWRALIRRMNRSN